MHMLISRRIFKRTYVRSTDSPWGSCSWITQILWKNPKYIPQWHKDEMHQWFFQVKQQNFGFMILSVLPPFHLPN